MGFKVRRKDQNIILILKQKLIKEVMENIIDQRLKYRV